MFETIDELDAQQVLLATQSMTERRRALEVEDLQLIAHWADLHGADPRRGPGGRRRWDDGGDQLVQVGGEGTPLVQELSLCELAVARQVHLLRLRSMLADVLDLRHRLPLTWQVTEDLGCEVWVARKVASMSRSLGADAVRVVDLAVADAIGTESPGRVIALTEAKVIEADRAAHAAKVEAERRRRFVSLSRTDEHGLRHVIARVEAGEAVWVDAMLERVADILAARPDLRADLPEEVSRDELRAEAFGWLARPEDLLDLLRHPEAPEGPEAPAAAEVPADRPRPAHRRQAVVYVHLHQAALDGSVAGVARVEDLGPLLHEQVARLVGHANITVKPVLDLRDQVRVNAYEHPESVKERAHLITVGEVFPHATRVSRLVDLDHPVRWDPGGPPGQTGDHNAAPLSRTHHRAKTHLGYQLRQTGPGSYVWTTPHGLHRHVDSGGTHVIDEVTANTLLLGDELDRALERIATEHGIALPV